MTNEEFAGHLLAALHGPHATDIAMRTIAVALETEAGRQAVLDCVAPELVELWSAVTELGIHAHLSGLSQRRSDPRAAMAMIDQRMAALGLIRERLTSILASNDNHEMASSLGLELPAKEPT